MVHEIIFIIWVCKIIYNDRINLCVRVCAHACACACGSTHRHVMAAVFISSIFNTSLYWRVVSLQVIGAESICYWFLVPILQFWKSLCISPVCICACCLYLTHVGILDYWYISMRCISLCVWVLLNPLYWCLNGLLLCLEWPFKFSTLLFGPPVFLQLTWQMCKGIMYG